MVKQPFIFILDYLEWVDLDGEIDNNQISKKNEMKALTNLVL